VTQRQVLNLFKMQIGKMSEASLKLALERKRASPAFLNRVLIESKNEKVLGLVVNHFLVKAKEGDAESKMFLNRMASEKFNKNKSLRKLIFLKFSNLATLGDSFGLRGMLVGVKDSDTHNRSWALKGLGELAFKGDARVLPGLFFGLRDSNPSNRADALSGLEKLSRLGDVRVLPGLILGLKDPVKGNRNWSIWGLENLSEKGNVQAKKSLEELKK
jgi:hypothetical protein